MSQAIPGFNTRVRTGAAAPNKAWAEAAQDLEAAAADLAERQKLLDKARAKQAQKELAIRAQGIEEGRNRQKAEDARLIDELTKANDRALSAQADAIRLDMLNLTVPAARAHGFWRGAAIGLALGAATAFAASYGLAASMVSQVFTGANKGAIDEPLAWDRNNPGETREP